MKPILIICLLSFVLPSIANANEMDTIASSRVWQKLLHISNGHTEIENEDFFLHTQVSDQNFALAELNKTIDAININAKDSSGFTFRCKYPARTTFLASHQLVEPLQDAECPLLREWIGGDSFNVSIIYADGFLGNPASFYGHLLLKFDNPGNVNSLLTNSVNFGAGESDNDNKVVYILKGLFGGYDANFTSNYFYRHNLNYTEVELRDLWKYKLNLNQLQKRLVAYHAWELMNTRYTYYFTHRNCAYHIAKLIELVTDQDLVSSAHPFVLPGSIFKAAKAAKVQSKILISDITYLPSRQTRLRSKLSSLPTALQEKLPELVEGNLEASLEGLDEEEKIVLLDLAYDYIEFLLTQLKDEPVLLARTKKRKLAIQIVRIQLPKSNVKHKVKQPILMPHDGHKPSLARLSFGQYNNTSFQELTIRPAFYDELSKGGGMLENSALSMLEVNIRVSENSYQISKVDLLNIETYPTGGSGLFKDTDLAWNTRLGYERNYIDGLVNTGEWFLEGGFGKTKKWGASAVVYATMNTRLQTPDQLINRAFIKPTIGIIGELPFGKYSCQLSYDMSIDNFATFKHRRIGCDASFFQQQAFDVRVGFQTYIKSSFSVGLSWYW
jgi:hypothetical protein